VFRLGQALRLASDHAFGPDAVHHPIREFYGLIWVGPPDQAEPTPPPGPTPVPGKTASFVLDSDAHGHLVDVIENLLDPLHTHFIHPGLVRAEGRRRTVRAVVEPVEGGVQARYLGEEQQRGLIARTFGGGVATSLGRYRWPATAELVYLDRGDQPLLVAHVAFQPVKDGRVRAYATVTGRPGWVPAWVAVPILRGLFRRVVAQDAAIVGLQAQGRRDWPDHGDVSTEVDLLRPAITRLLREGPTARVRPREVEVGL
jgi:phenylpropionate dioxygenase-like ring-hydroxylating dioxygenase large terminal subunit